MAKALPTLPYSHRQCSDSIRRVATLSFCLGLLCAKTAPLPADPLEVIPPNVIGVVKVERPTKLVDTAWMLWNYIQPASPNYRRFQESAAWRRVQHMVRYVEKETGRGWKDLLFEVSGRGAALVFFPTDPVGVALVLDGTSEPAVQRLYRVTIALIESEQNRQEKPDAKHTSVRRGVEVTGFGDNLFLAAYKSVFLVANRRTALDDLLDQVAGDPKHSFAYSNAYRQARPLIPDGSLVWAWQNLDIVKRDENIKNLLALPSFFPPFHILFGGLLDVVHRSSFLVVSASQVDRDMVLELRLPAGSAGMRAPMQAHLARAAGKDTPLLPLLQPEHTVVSLSFCLDWAQLWRERSFLFPVDQLKVLEEFDKNSGRFLFGTRLGQLLEMLGRRHRLVIAYTEPAYKRRPPNRLPGFALALELREPEAFARAIEAPLRTVGLLGSFGVDMQLIEEQVDGERLIAYRFEENDKNQAIGDGVLFHFTPCFARVGNQFLLCSDMVLAKRLIPVLKAPGTADAPAGTAVLAEFSFQGLAKLFEASQHYLVVQQVLEQGLPTQEAQEVVLRQLQFFSSQKNVRMQVLYEPHQYCQRLVWTLAPSVKKDP